MRCAALAVALLAVIACRARAPNHDCASRRAAPGERARCQVPGWTDRGFDLDVPARWDGTSRLPVIVAYHGGGGHRESARRVTCPRGDERDPGCLVAMANARGYAVVTPDGTPAKLARDLRTWNGGGGTSGAYCASGRACADNVDDVKYTEDLLATVSAMIPVDARRVYATGLSNGAAMAHRIGCERPGTISAIVAVGGANQHGDGGDPCGALPVLQIHGSADPCWPYAGGVEGCLEQKGRKTSVDETMAGWARRNACSGAPRTVALPDRDPSDGTTARRTTWPGCKAATELIVVEGGGHTWPSGWPYLERSGAVTRDFGNEVILDFFDATARR